MMLPVIEEHSVSTGGVSQRKQQLTTSTVPPARTELLDPEDYETKTLSNARDSTKERT